MDEHGLESLQESFVLQMRSQYEKLDSALLRVELAYSDPFDHACSYVSRERIYGLIRTLEMYLTITGEYASEHLASDHLPEVPEL
jgi:hypothetical protein